jgi:hypothetical protein
MIGNVNIHWYFTEHLIFNHIVLKYRKGNELMFYEET